MSFVLLGILNSAAAGGGFEAVYRLQTLGGSSGDVPESLVLDSDNNLYVVGRTRSSGAGLNDFLIAKYDASGTIQWQRTLGGSSQDLGYGITTDSDNNLYVVGYTESAGAGGKDFLLAKYDSSGTIQFQRVLGGADDDQGESVAIDSTDNVYVLGETQSTGAGSYDFLLAKYDSSGSIQWQRVLGGASSDSGNSVAIDSSSNLYLAGFTFSAGAGSNDGLVAKYNSSGTIQWQRVLGSSNNERLTSVATDSSGNIYVSGFTNNAGAVSGDILLVKYNSSGTVQWQRILGGTGFEESKAVAVDSSNNIYVTSTFNNDFLIAKYNSSGTIQWQRTLGGSSQDEARSLNLDSSGNVYVTGNTRSVSASDDFLIAVLPNDGSLTGTYVLGGANIVYAVSSATAGSASLTASTSSLTSATSSLTGAVPSLTSASASLSTNRVDL